MSIKSDEKYRRKILSVIEQRGLCSMMNSTKWTELKKGVSELPFSPPFVIKGVDEEEAEYHQFDKDVYYGGDWGLYLDNYLGGDIYATPFYAVEWIKIRPRILKHQGNLIPCTIIDETDQFLNILIKYNIPYNENNGVFTVYGYRQ